MGFFGRDKSSNNRSSSSMANQKKSIQDQVNLVGEGTVFDGTLRAESDVRASGRIVGRLEVEGKAIVAESGVVEGEVVATNADVAGQVQGEIHVSERLVLKSTARVDGNIQTDRLVVEEGAVFTGECRMGEPVSTNGEADASSESGSSGSGASDSGSSGASAKGSPSSKAKSAATSGSSGSKGSSSKSASGKSSGGGNSSSSSKTSTSK
jgi:cytoskeletal protein CcmA (bactofilin family)